MRHKIADAYKCFRKAEYEQNNEWRECKKVIPVNVRSRFNELWTSFISGYRKRIREKFIQKVKWLREKWTIKDKEPPKEYRGIQLEFNELSIEFTSNPRKYGGIHINESEEEVLSLPPKFGLYQKVETVDCIIETEKALTKLRWHAVHSSDITCDDTSSNPAEFFDETRKEFNINKLKVTDLPYNPSVMMPKAVDIETEVKYQQFKNEVRVIAEDVANKTRKWKNLSSIERSGLISIKDKIKKTEIVCYQTDKSGRWSCDTPNNYIKACEKHLVDNESICEKTLDDQKDAERKLNCHALALLIILGVNYVNKRLKNAIVSHGNVIAPFYCLRKDHKPVEVGKEEEGPKTRPVCGANDCQTRRLSYILCLILRELIPYHKYECDATDVLLNSFEMLNETPVNPKWCVGSLDVTALYPSLDMKNCVKVIGARLYNSEMVFQNLQWKEIALYLKYHLSIEECTDDDMRRYLPRRKYKGKNPIFVCSGSKNDSKERYEPWMFDSDGPDEIQMRKMFCKAMEIIIMKALSLHDFTFNGKIYRQEKGGAIGLDLVGVVASIYMNDWDSRLVEVLMKENITPQVYKRYVDDINLILDLSNDKLDDERSVMEFIKNEANKIDENIQVTYDYSKRYDDGRLPVLDVKVWIGLNKNGEYKVLHSHYVKDVSSRLLIHSRSAHDVQMKFNVCVNEALRVIKNCSYHLDWEECRSNLEYFVMRLQYSGYDHKYRYKVIEASLKKYEKLMVEYNVDGKFFQNMIKQRSERSKRKDRKHSWYSKDGKYQSVMFIPATPESELKNRIQNTANKYKIPIKIVEKVNESVKKNLQRSNPFSLMKCGRTDCKMCQLECKTSCRVRGIVYELICTDCEKIIYRGQTSRSGYERINEHFDEWDESKKIVNRMRNKPDNKKLPILQTHSEKVHNNGDFKVAIKIISRNFGDPMKRLITESVLIEEVNDEYILNSKHEWGYVRLPKVTMDNM